MDSLAASIDQIRGVGPKMAKLLSKKGIATVEDALFFLPRDYEDRRYITPIRDLFSGRATVLVTITSVKQIRGSGRKNRLEVSAADETGSMTLSWFNAYPQLLQQFQIHRKFLFYGEVRFFHGVPTIAHPEYEPVEDTRNGKPVASANFGRVIPVYSETEGLHQKTIRKIMIEVLKMGLPGLSDPLPDDLRSRLSLPGLKESFVAIHYPSQHPSPAVLSKPLRRIVFEEFFVLQLGLGLQKRERERWKAPSVSVTEETLSRFLGALPFDLTQDQKVVLDELKVDLNQPYSMSRLVQGDVGSGKTVVAFAAAYIAACNQYQTVLLAPTEVLAHQHYRNAMRWLSPLGVGVELAVHGFGKAPAAQRVANGTSLVVIGTHAVLQEKVQFHRLGLVVVDEQHRFGVDQRNELLKKSKLRPHLLMMTATPIPRTLALSVYGDLDLSFIRQKPAGRKPIKTQVLFERERPKLYQRIRETVKRGNQVYIIYPLVEASEKLELKSATEMHERLSREIFPELRVVLLHGRMKPEEKERVLKAYANGEYDILVSTTVIEVGIDIANATLMVIEHPERLGLSQLHQLRGRVGRGEAESQCLLIVDQRASQRLRILERTEDGFEIAEADLKIRGPGEFLGTRQSGVPGFRVGDITRDADLLVLAKTEADRILEDDPNFIRPENAGIRKMMESRWNDKLARLRGG